MAYMNILNHAIAVAGSPTALAKQLGVEPNVVGNWKYRQSLPKPWAQLLQTKYGRRKAPVKN